MQQLLFVDDDEAVLTVNRDYFEKRGYCVYTAKTADEALDCVRRFPVDCIVLDIMLPGTDGFALCEEVRAQVICPVIFLTCLTEKEFLYQGFFLGGDDFLTKPYDFLELEMRIRARINQHKGLMVRHDRLEFPPLVIDSGTRRVTVDEAVVPLTAYEFEILLLLARFPDKTFSLEEVYREIWRLPDLENAQTVKVHVARMRRKLEVACPDRVFIKTIWKKGYQFLAKPEKEESV